MNGLVLNLGLKGIRSIIFDNNGKIIAHSYQKIHTYLNKDFVEQDPEEWWRKGLECIKETLKIERNIEFITITASAACVIPVDKEGKHLTRTIMVSDKRASKQAEYISTLESFQKLKYKSGVYYTLPRILWVKENLPEVYQQTHHFISPNEFFIHKLTNKFWIDPLNATKYYTVNNEYPEEVLNKLNIEKNKLPEIKPIGSSTTLSKSISQELNLNEKTKVIITTYDAICAFFGSGPEKEGDACDMSGTVTSLRTLTKNSLKEGEQKIFEQKYKEWNIIGGSNNLGGGLIEWALEIFYNKNEHEKLELLKNEVASEKGVLFLPYLLGERAPLWDDNVRGTFLGIERFHTKENLARAVLESTGFLLKQLIEIVENNQININRLYVSGGLAKLDIINQIKADITGKQIIKLKETESTAFGAYCLARQAIDPDFNPNKSLEIEKIYIPDITKHKNYSNSYELFQNAYESLKEFHNKRKQNLNIGEIQRSSL